MTADIEHAYYTGPLSDHFDGKQFFNPWSPRSKKSVWDILKWRFEGGRAEWPEIVTNELRAALEESSSDIKVTYIGHATFLVQLDQINILVDPVFSERASPFSMMGPKRVREPFVHWDKLPKIDYVFVSHNHYDHLDQPSLAWLARNHKPVFITPLGNSRHIEPCVESCSILSLDWHQQIVLPGKSVLALTPAQHWSRRGLNDINRDLWGGFYLKSGQGKAVYYSGDTGFHQKLFEGIHEKYGSPDIALLPIGAYSPRWFMRYSHMDPEEAVRAYGLLQAKSGIAFHFETFQLSDEAFEAPRVATMTALKSHSINPARFLIPYPGDFLKV